MTKNANYQMEFKWIGGGKSWSYFYAKENIHEEAVKVANQFMATRKIQFLPIHPFSDTPPKFPKKVLVRQYDNVKKCAVKGGDRFVLTRSGFTAKTNRRTIKEEWYEYQTD